MREILIAEEHDQIYQVLLDRQVHNIAVVHIDFHCDMRGLMIDRLRGVAYMINKYETEFVDDGNFLSHAIMDGLVSSIRWVHDYHGGRRYDFGATAKYESDTTAASYRLLHRLRRGHEVSIAFEELLFQDWDGVQSGEYLDIDWDAIASIQYRPSHIRKLMEEFLNRKFPVIPETTFLVFSPGYSIPNRNMFEEFITRLKKKFSAHIVRLPKPIKQPESRPLDRTFSWHVADYIRRYLPRALIALAYKALRRLHAYDTRHDIRPLINSEKK